MGFLNYVWQYQAVRANAHTFAQLYLRPIDMLKFGILFYQRGKWSGRQLVARGWVERSTAPISRIGSRSFGFYWWNQTFNVSNGGTTQEVRTILASGNGGQKIYIVPSLGLVAVFTGGEYNSEEDSSPNAIMSDVILPELILNK